MKREYAIIALLFCLFFGCVGWIFSGPEVQSCLTCAGDDCSFDGNADLTGAVTQHVLLPVNNDAVTPTISFGATGTGFYAPNDAQVNICTGGVAYLYLSADGIATSSGYGPYLANETVSATNPTLVPGREATDMDTGIGKAAADQLSLISGGVEMVRLTEATSTATSARYSVGNAAHGGYSEAIYSATSGTLAGATDTIPLAIPSGWRITQCKLHVKTAVSDDDGDDTWTAALQDATGEEEAIGAALAAAQNTNVDHWAVADTAWTLTDEETYILLTPNGTNFDGGEIEAHCIAQGFSAWTNE